MKKMYLILAVVLIFLNSCNGTQTEQHEFDGQFENQPALEPFGYNLEPRINGFYGVLFGERDVTAGRNYTGFERLDSFGGLIYCNNDRAIMRIDHGKQAVYRLDSQNPREKICPREDCRNDIDGVCGHIPVYELIYSDGFLYFSVSETNGVSVYRYDIDSHEYEKLMEFQDIGYISIALNGRYLYARIYNWEKSVLSGINPNFYKADIMITRIDLSAETAVVVCSDIINPDDYDKIAYDELKDWRFIDHRIIMPQIMKLTFGIKRLRKSGLHGRAAQSI